MSLIKQYQKARKKPKNVNFRPSKFKRLKVGKKKT